MQALCEIHYIGENMKILIACEESGIVTEEFRKKGHEAYSCDILPTSGNHPEWHLQQDVTGILKENKLLQALHTRLTSYIIIYITLLFSFGGTTPAEKT